MSPPFDTDFAASTAVAVVGGVGFGFSVEIAVEENRRMKVVDCRRWRRNMADGGRRGGGEWCSGKVGVSRE